MGAPEALRHRAMTAFKLHLPLRFQKQAEVLFAATESLFRQIERTSVFFSFGAEGIEPELTQRFARTNWERACRQAQHNISVPKSLIDAFSRLDIKVVAL
jgi:hypothetical protein